MAELPYYLCALRSRKLTKPMQNIRKAVSTVILAAMTTTLAACGASSVGVKPTSVRSSQLDGLVLTSGKSPTLIYQKPNAAGFEAYSHFIVDPVRIDYSDPNMRDLKYEDVARMQRFFQSQVVSELRDGGYDVTTRIQPDTMRMNFTITGMKAPSAAANVSVLLAPIAISVGEVTVEATFTDAETNEVQAVVVDRSRGSRALNKSAWSTWADVEDAFKTWAKGIRGAVDEAKGR